MSRAYSSRSYGKTGSAEVVGAFGSGELIQAFVGNPFPIANGRFSRDPSGEDARPGRGVGKGFPTYGGTVVGRQSLAGEDARLECGVGKGFPTYGGTVVGRQSLADEDAWPGHGVGKGGFGAPIANGHPRSAGMTLPIANDLAGSAGHALPEDAVCDWKGPIKGPFAIGRVIRALPG